MTLKDIVEKVLAVVSEILTALQSKDLGWWGLKRILRRELWRKLLKPLIKKQDLGWIPQAQRFVAMIYLLLFTFANSPEIVNKAALSDKKMLRLLAEKASKD